MRNFSSESAAAAEQRVREISEHIKRADPDHTIAIEALESTMALFQLVEANGSASSRNLLEQAYAERMRELADRFRLQIAASLGPIIGGLHMSEGVVLDEQIATLYAQKQLVEGAEDDRESRLSALCELETQYGWTLPIDADLQHLLTDDVEWLCLGASFDSRARHLAYLRQQLQDLFERVVQHGEEVWPKDPS